jgi:hypothetical protein
MVSPFVSLVVFAQCYFARLHIKPDRIARSWPRESSMRTTDDCAAKKPAML